MHKTVRGRKHHFVTTLLSSWLWLNLWNISRISSNQKWNIKFTRKLIFLDEQLFLINLICWSNNSHRKISNCMLLKYKNNVTAFTEELKPNWRQNNNIPSPSHQHIINIQSFVIIIFIKSIFCRQLFIYFWSGVHSSWPLFFRSN
jgi:hypothetical protein